MPHSLQKILYIEDDATLAHLLQARMQRNNLKVDTVTSAEAGLATLTQNNYDLILVDHHLPGMSGLEFLDRLTESPESPPVIILTTSGDDHAAVSALERGAADYVVKDGSHTYLDLLPAIMQAAHTRRKLMRENEMQRLELKAAKERAEAASQAKSNFLATMSHEMRTPLNVIIGLARLLAKTNLSAKEHQMAETLLTNADLLLKLINDLLDISRIEEGVLEMENIGFDFSSVLSDVKTMFATAMMDKKLRFTIVDETNACKVTGDRIRVHQILMNLVGNALKFTNEGEITVHAMCEQSGDEARFSIEVRDTGIGISPAKLQTIFDKFTQADESITRRFGGSGLGLSIARSLAERMGGTITAQSAQGQGSTFTVTLVFPLAYAKPEEKAVHATEQKDPDSLRRTVLVVEDYAPNVMVASMILDSLGYDAVTAENGHTALACIEHAHAPFAAILMDVQMQEMDGFEATKRIRALEEEKGIRNVIIGVTAHALAGDRERCISAGMDDYMSKPIHPDLLAAKLLRLREGKEKAA